PTRRGAPAVCPPSPALAGGELPACVTTAVPTCPPSARCSASPPRTRRSPGGIPPGLLSFLSATRPSGRAAGARIAVVRTWRRTCFGSLLGLGDHRVQPRFEVEPGPAIRAQLGGDDTTAARFVLAVLHAQ